ncbi:MAG: hypothetical protein QM831_02345 [Kofleriaceae bacterium]
METRVDALEGASDASNLLDEAFGTLIARTEVASAAYTAAYTAMKGTLDAATRAAEESRKFLFDMFLSAMGPLAVGFAARMLTNLGRRAEDSVLRRMSPGDRPEMRERFAQGRDALREQATEQVQDTVREVWEATHPPEDGNAELPGEEPTAWHSQLIAAINLAKTSGNRAIRAARQTAAAGGARMDPNAIVAAFSLRVSGLPTPLDQRGYARSMWQRWLDRFLFPEHGDEAPRTEGELDTILTANRHLLDGCAAQMGDRTAIDAAVARARTRIASTPAPMPAHANFGHGTGMREQARQRNARVVPSE